MLGGWANRLRGANVPAKSDIPFDGMAAVRDFLRDWLKESEHGGIACRENLSPHNEPAADYEVVYEALFEPEPLDQVRVEFWVTADAHVAVGLERWSRVARRLGIKSSSRRFVAGHDFVRITEAKLETILSLAANGDVVVGARVLPLLGLTAADMVALAENETSAKDLRRLLPWLRTAPRSKYNGNHSVLRYSPWPPVGVTT